MTAFHIALFMFGLAGGGVPRRMITLANALARAGRRVDLVVVDASGPLRASVDPAVRVVEVGGWRTRLPVVRRKRRRQFAVALRPLAAYLKRERPNVVLAADNYANLAAIDARGMLGADIAVVASQRNHTSTYAAGKERLLGAIKTTYPKADAIVAVSEGVADDLRALGLPPDRISTIYNPVVDSALLEAAARPIDHPWFGVTGRPLILAAGRIGPQKDFPTLLRAFARVRAAGRDARLVILGEGKTPEARTDLEALARDLGVAEHVALPGFVPVALPYIARADLFVLSSAWEGLPGVLVEALACGTPAVSTDCPSGPFEILDGGRYGRLTPVGDAGALALAMEATLSEPADRERLRARGRMFGTDEAAGRYLALLDEVVRRRLAT